MLHKYGWFILLILSASCYKEPGVTAGDVIRGLDKSPLVGTADGESRVTLAVRLPNGTIDGKRSVTFTTTTGIFDGSDKNTVTVDAIDTQISNQTATVAYASLKSPLTQDTALVTIKVQNFTAQQEVIFAKAFPEALTLTTDKIYLKASADSEATLTVQLKRRKGTPTIGHPIALTVTDPANKEVGNYRNKNLTSDATGKITNYFSITDTTYFGKTLKVRATTQNERGQTLTDTLSLFIIKP